MQRENVKRDNRVLIDFWDQAVTLSEKQKAQFRNQQEDWKEPVYLALLPEAAVRILVNADLGTIKERFKARMHEVLPASAERKLESKHGMFDTSADFTQRMVESCGKAENEGRKRPC